ncbi:MAG: mobilization protein [Gammaproteobacteria bacterium]|nr:mobilization protein [Gammaproteobacteria bacterium]
MKTKPSKLESLKKQQEQLKAKIQALEAAETSRERKRETRRKILVGSYYLDKARSENKFDDLVQLMDGYLNRDSDRVLFDLALSEKSKKSLE